MLIQPYFREICGFTVNIAKIRYAKKSIIILITLETFIEIIWQVNYITLSTYFQEVGTNLVKLFLRHIVILHICIEPKYRVGEQKYKVINNKQERKTTLWIKKQNNFGWRNTDF